MRIIKLRDKPALIPQAAAWFSAKWGIEEKAYRESMEEMAARWREAGPEEKAKAAALAVPQWYVAVADDEAEGGPGLIAGGIGVIENDYHDRKDLAPNVCALYVEEEFRGRGLAGELLSVAAGDMRDFGIKTLYLITEHTSFYERYGWRFLCMAQPDGEAEKMRTYVRTEPQ